MRMLHCLRRVDACDIIEVGVSRLQPAPRDHRWKAGSGAVQRE